MNVSIEHIKQCHAQMWARSPADPASLNKRRSSGSNAGRSKAQSAKKTGNTASKTTRFSGVGGRKCPFCGSWGVSSYHVNGCLRKARLSPKNMGGGRSSTGGSSGGGGTIRRSPVGESTPVSRCEHCGAPIAAGTEGLHQCP